MVDVIALVLVAHRRLRLRRLLVAIERDPSILEGLDMNRSIGRPIQLAGFSSRLVRAEKLEQGLEVTGQRYDAVLDEVEDQKRALDEHVGSLEVVKTNLDQVIGRMTAGSNGAPNGGDGSSKDSSEGMVGQVITSRTEG
ncbi:hypothetical protein ABID65_003310 [Bradyrhizobium sp. S3.9.2]|uniref:hypothetical protein n=1 Tax=Bradyrhizobium sp. S3.9.2 TaxID=3156432 RepID=UPI003392D6FA